MSWSKVRIGKIDIIALILAITTLFLIKILGISQAILCIILIDFLILVPTLKKLYFAPETEDPLAWIMA